MNPFSYDDHVDIQGLVLFGYGHAKHAKYLLLNFKDATKTRKWLGDIADHITRKSKVFDPTRDVFNLAFTYQGFQKLGVPDHILEQFDYEFREGMDTEHRNRVLGDVEKNAPGNWNWGANRENNTALGKDDIDAVLCIFGNYRKDEPKVSVNDIVKEIQLEDTETNREPTPEEDDKKVYGFRDHLKSVLRGVCKADIQVVHEMSATTYPDNKEHFGFRDGISQPVLEGTVQQKTNSDRANVVSLGEFVLGFVNEYKEINNSPILLQSQDKTNALPYRETYKDFGRNGSYMVFRQLEQDVRKFWEYSYQQANGKQPEDSSSPLDLQEKAAMIKLASKMVGRWPSGVPLANNAYEDLFIDKRQSSGYLADGVTQTDQVDKLIEKRSDEELDTFGYRQKDPYGHMCPVGSHLRRSNPRDALSDTANAKESVMLVNRHRLLRRGRVYGQSAAGNQLDPEELLKTSSGDVGLHFICFNGNLATQFEFVQHAWLNRATFAGLYNSQDPLVGYNKGNEFYAEGCPVSKRYKDVPQFVTTKGGAYFFMPGIRAIKYIAGLKNADHDL